MHDHLNCVRMQCLVSMSCCFLIFKKIHILFPLPQIERPKTFLTELILMYGSFFFLYQKIQKFCKYTVDISVAFTVNISKNGHISHAYKVHFQSKRSHY